MSEEVAPLAGGQAAAETARRREGRRRHAEAERQRRERKAAETNGGQEGPPVAPAAAPAVVTQQKNFRMPVAIVRDAMSPCGNLRCAPASLLRRRLPCGHEPRPGLRAQVVAAHRRRGARQARRRVRGNRVKRHLRQARANGSPFHLLRSHLRLAARGLSFWSGSSSRLDFKDSREMNCDDRQANPGSWPRAPPPTDGWSWIDRRFLREHAGRLSHEAIVLYFFLPR